MSASSYIDYTYRKRTSGHDGFRQSASTNNTFRNDPEFPVHLTMSGGRGGGNWRANKFGKRGGSSGPGGGAKDDKIERGRFDNGIWLCDCNPRLPAEHFQVKKESANKGKWFYTCQRGSMNRPKNQEHLHIPLGKEQGCKFFLWDEDAKPREEAAVLMGARSEPRALLSQEEKRKQAREVEAMQGQQASITGKRKRSVDEAGSRTPTSMRTVVYTATPPQSPTVSFASAMSETMSLPPKRKLPWLSDKSQKTTSTSSATTASQTRLSNTASRAKSTTTAAYDDAETASEASSDGEAFDWPLSGQEAAELERVAEEVELNTPRKARKLDVFDTPSHAVAKQTHGLITPGTTPSKSHSIPTATYPNTDTTPTPSRYRDALATPTSLTTPSPNTNTSLTPSFLSLLRDHNITIPNPALNAMTTLLHRNEAQLAGAVKGREIARQAVKAREETVARLTGRVEGLEEEVAGLKALVSALGMTTTSPRKKTAGIV